MRDETWRRVVAALGDAAGAKIEKLEAHLRAALADNARLRQERQQLREEKRGLDVGCRAYGLGPYSRA